MQGRCERHNFERAADVCGRCGLEFCSECVVYSFGQHKPPFCIPCATVASGVRSATSTRPPLSRREYKQLAKARRRMLREHGTVFPQHAQAPGPAAAFEWITAEEATA